MRDRDPSRRLGAGGIEGEAYARRDSLGDVAYVLVLLAVPLVMSNALRTSESMTYGDIPLALAALLLLPVWLRHGHPAGAVPAGFLAGVILLLTAGILAMVPPENADSLVPTLRSSLTLGLMPVIVMLAAHTARRIQRLVDAWLLGAGINSAVGVLDLIGPTTIGRSLTSVDFVGFTDRAAGLTLHPNHLGLVAAMALPVAVARLGAAGSRRILAVGLVPVLIAGVAVSGSRGAAIAATAGVAMLFVFGVTTYRSRTTYLLFIASAVTFAILVAALGNDGLIGSVTVDRLRGGGGATQSDAIRVVTLRESVERGVANPIVGNGFSAVRTAHNIYVQFLQAGGLLALAGFLAFAMSILRRMRHLATRSNESPPWLMTLAAASGASVCVWLLFGMVGNAVYDRYLYLPVGLALALSFAQRRFPVGTGSEAVAMSRDATGAAPEEGRLDRLRVAG